ncbi:MAG TPA: endonuclease [Anaerolineae bacterium]|nr:endonuclease [Anaerolineae bacterium]
MKAYDQVILRVFEDVYQDNSDAHLLLFTKADIENVIKQLDLALSTRNVPDIVYTYRSGRSPLPAKILATGSWAIEGKGKGQYAFRRLSRSPHFDIPADIRIIEILDSTPQIVLKYQNSDEQAMLARLRYNRLIDLFTGLTCYHLQSHFRTTVSEIGQIEIDDLYIGIDADGKGYILPLEAKIDSPKDQLGVIQVTQMVRFAAENFEELIIRPIGVKAMPDGSLMFIEFTPDSDLNTIATETYKRYLLVREL